MPGNNGITLNFQSPEILKIISDKITPNNNIVIEILYETLTYSTLSKKPITAAFKEACEKASKSNSNSLELNDLFTSLSCANGETIFLITEPKSKLLLVLQDDNFNLSAKTSDFNAKIYCNQLTEQEKPILAKHKLELKDNPLKTIELKITQQEEIKFLLEKLNEWETAYNNTGGLTSNKIGALIGFYPNGTPQIKNANLNLTIEEIKESLKNSNSIILHPNKSLASELNNQLFYIAFYCQLWELILHPPKKYCATIQDQFYAEIFFKKKKTDQSSTFPSEPRSSAVNLKRRTILFTPKIPETTQPNNIPKTIKTDPKNDPRIGMYERTNAKAEQQPENAFFYRGRRPSLPRCTLL